jgi:hypothetical protein
MNKREVVWLIVRLIGVYFAYLAVVSVFTLAGSISAFYTLNSDTSTSTKTETDITRNAPPGFPPGRVENEPKPVVKTDPASEKLKSDAFKSLLLYLFLTGLYGVTGFYLIAKGTILFNILNKEDPSTRSKESVVTTIKF